MNGPNYPAAIPPMCLFYCIGFYRAFDSLGLEKAREIANRASEISGEHALQYECGSDIVYDLPHIGKASPGRVLTAMAAFLVWQQFTAGIEHLPDSPMLQACADGWRLYQLDKKHQELPDVETP